MTELPLDVGIRAVPVDKLTRTSNEDELQVRLTSIDNQLKLHEAFVEEARERLARAEDVIVFLRAERENVVLVQKLQRGDVVRVVCYECDGSGMKPVDVISGQYKQGSAFESVSAQKQKTPEVPEHLRCTRCQGERWLIMDRFKG